MRDPRLESIGYHHVISKISATALIKQPAGSQGHMQQTVMTSSPSISTKRNREMAEPYDIDSNGRPSSKLVKSEIKRSELEVRSILKKPFLGFWARQPSSVTAKHDWSDYHYVRHLFKTHLLHLKENSFVVLAGVLRMIADGFKEEPIDCHLNLIIAHDLYATVIAIFPQHSVALKLKEEINALFKRVSRFNMYQNPQGQAPTTLYENSIEECLDQIEGLYAHDASLATEYLMNIFNRILPKISRITPPDGSANYEPESHPDPDSESQRVGSTPSYR